MSILMAIAAVLIWFLAAFYFSRRTGWASLFPDAFVRVAAGMGALTLAIQALGEGFTLATLWPAWAVAAAGVAMVEGICGLYTLERRAVEIRTGRILLGLRLGMVFLLLLMLLQPV